MLSSALNFIVLVFVRLFCFALVKTPTSRRGGQQRIFAFQRHLLFKVNYLKWYYDQNSPYLFFLHFESMNYKYLPCQILSHDFKEKSDFLNYKFLIRLPAITQFKSGRVQKRVESREDVTSSNQDIKTNVATLVCRRGVRASCFILILLFFVYACFGKDYAV